jgi:hypothetical protein
LLQLLSTTTSTSPEQLQQHRAWRSTNPDEKRSLLGFDKQDESDLDGGRRTLADSLPKFCRPFSSTIQEPGTYDWRSSGDFAISFADKLSSRTAEVPYFLPACNIPILNLRTSFGGEPLRSWTIGVTIRAVSVDITPSTSVSSEANSVDYGGITWHDRICEGACVLELYCSASPNSYGYDVLATFLLDIGARPWVCIQRTDLQNRDPDDSRTLGPQTFSLIVVGMRKQRKEWLML